MSLFGSNWIEDDQEIGPFSHWKEDSEEIETEDKDISLFSRFTDDNPSYEKIKSRKYKE